MDTNRFSCIKMKEEIQAKVAKKLDGLSSAQREVEFQKLLERNPKLAAVWRNAKRIDYANRHVHAKESVSE